MLGLLIAGVPVARALPGEAAAVIQRCGTPDSESKGVSPVTNVMERNLSYGQIILHFEPAEGGWTFRSAWDDHMPLTRAGVSRRMPCFEAAMAAVAAAPQAAVDPTIAEQTRVPTTTTRWNFGIPFLWLIVAMAAALLVFVVLPSSPKMRTRVMEMEDRPFRRPRVKGFRFRRKPRGGDEV